MPLCRTRGWRETRARARAVGERALGLERHMKGGDCCSRRLTPHSTRAGSQFKLNHSFQLLQSDCSRADTREHRIECVRARDSRVYRSQISTHNRKREENKNKRNSAQNRRTQAP